MEYAERIDPILADNNGEKEHLHNQLVAAILGNVTREMPDQGLAPWVSANDKPAAATGTKPVTGDATERKLKGEVMQLPPRDRRRIKDLVQNDVSWGICFRTNVRLSDNASVRPSRRHVKLFRRRAPQVINCCRYGPKYSDGHQQYE